MNVDTEKMMLRQIIAKKKDIFVVEDSIIIPDIKPDILSIVNTSANLYMCKKDYNNNKLKVDGGVQLDTAYISDDKNNNTRALHNTIDFSKNIDIENDGKSDLDYICSFRVKSIEPKILNGRKINIRATIEYEITVYSNTQTQFVKAVTGDEQVQIQSKNIRFSITKNMAETAVSARENISIDENLADILTESISLKNREEKVSYNKVLTKADCCVDMVYITEDEQLKNASAQIPIMGFIDIPGISEAETIETNYEIKNIEIKPDATDNRAIQINIDFSVRCITYEEKEVDLIQDLYSPDKEIEINQRNVNLEQNKKYIQDICEIGGKLDFSGADGSSGVFITNIAENNVSHRIENGSILYEGSMVVDYLYKSKEAGRLEHKNECIDFSHVISADELGPNSEIETNYDVFMEENRAMSGLSGDIKFNVLFRVEAYNKIAVNIIDDAKVLDEMPRVDTSSLVVYYVKEGDTMWKIAKRFRTTIDEIVEINDIEDANVLQIGTQLFIPKHVGVRVYE